MIIHAPIIMHSECIKIGTINAIFVISLAPKIIHSECTNLGNVDIIASTLKCDNCEYSCYRKDLLAVHDNKNHNGIQLATQYCDKCDFTSVYKSSLLQHMKCKQLSQGKYCYECNYSCTTNARLKEQINVVNKGRSC